MNLFILSLNFQECAECMFDKHVSKIILEAVQMLCTTIQIIDPDNEIQNEIKNNLNNPIIQDILNQYTALWQSCDLNEAKKWIKDNTFYQDFAESHRAFENFIQEIKQLPNCPKNLLLNNLEDHGPRFNIANLSSKDEKNLQSVFMKITLLGSDPQVRTLLQNTGCGFSSRQVL